ncbi:tripartite-type tricarboxylate transporter receptor subunit TctC [Rhodoligotrophos appendicifer]|uniref:Bug family tripartite tricarboxylate transporter substrate binding protein n=1 Tax=Rhodoligotrophos appendicifer TaxID=987056 RepID=UPI00117E2A1F|nr:tripartite tricarboxylate transporter substrate binding protein [Rhodoligotrophos appendicifer]
MIKRCTLMMRVLFLALCAVMLVAPQARAEYPDQTIKFVVPFPAGGSTDIAARLIAEQLSQRLGVTIVIDNQPGASGLIGASSVVRAKPDGYTFLVTSNGIHSAAATGTANFDLKTDLVPVSQIVGGALMLVGSKEAPFDTIQGFVEYAQKDPDKVNIAINAALGSAHMAFERFRRMVKIEYQPIFYPGESPSLAALVSGESAVGIISAPAARALVEDGKVNGLAVTTQERFALLPNIPTLNETVAPGYADGYSTVIFAPKGTPNDIVQKMSREIAEVVRQPETAKKLLELGLTAMGSTPEEYAAIVAADFDRNVTLIAELRASGLAE